MGAGILPTAVHDNKLYFLFGKENKNEKSAPGFSDFGGGTDHKETFLQTAIREGGEELTGFLGSDGDLRNMLQKHGTYTLDIQTGDSKYRTHIFPYAYDSRLPHYYNNNQRFLQKRLDPEVIRQSKIFEKAEIRWICVDDLAKMRPYFRHFYRPMVDQMIQQKEMISRFIRPHIRRNPKVGSTIKGKAHRNKRTRNTRRK